jgi:hypothetical protein
MIIVQNKNIYVKLVRVSVVPRNQNSFLAFEGDGGIPDKLPSRVLATIGYS